MSISIKTRGYKEGAHIGERYSIPFGALSAGITRHMQKRTLEEIGEALLRQLKIKKGEVILSDICFTYRKVETVTSKTEKSTKKLKRGGRQ